MKYLYSILLILISVSIAESQWVSQSSGTTNILTNVFFVDANTGTAIGLSGTIRKTTNGGVSWVGQTVPSNHLYGIHFINSSTGFLDGDAVFYRTTNGGTTWSNPGGPVQLNRGVYFTSNQTGFICCTGGLIFKTTDGGSTWVGLTSGTAENLNTMTFADASTGYISGYTGTVLKTTNGGDNWQVLNTGVTDLLFGLAVINANIVYAGGENGKIIKTTDGGASWEIQNSTISGRITGLSFLNANTGTGSSHSNFIVRTTNGGATWNSQPVGLTGQDFYGVSFVNVQTGYVVGSNGNILQTSNGGWPIPNAPNLTLPVNGAVNISLTPLLDWDSVATAKTYQLQLSLDTNYTSNIIDSSLILNSSLNVPSGRLNNNVRYFWHTRCENAGGMGPWSANFNFRTIVALPNAPGLLTPVNGASNVPLLPVCDWDSTSPVDFYRIQMALDTSFSDPWVDITNITESYIDAITPPLQPNFRYYWRVSATNAAGTGPWSTKFNFTTILGMPAAPALLTPTNFATGISLTPLLDWIDDISATNYQVQLSQDSTFGTTLFDTTGFALSQVNLHSGLLTNVVTYFWRVRTTNPIGTGPYSQPFRFTTLLSPPGSPNLVSPPNNSIDISTTPTLDWDSVQYSATFKVQLSTDSTFTTAPLINAIGLTFSQYNVPGGVLSNNTVYFWRVNASNTAGTGPYSPVWKFRTVVTPPVAAPTLLAPPNGSTNQPVTLTLDWNDVFGSTGYKLIISTDSLFNTTVLDTTITTSAFTVPPGRLSGSTQYYWRVRAFNVGGFGPWSLTWRFSTMLIGIEPVSEIIPDRFMLYNNYPNPFNPFTNIDFDIPANNTSGNVNLTVYDITGKEIVVLVNSMLRPGKYSVSWNASNYSSGLYFYRITAGNFTSIRKMVLVK
ncbi:MAG: YCF48-related protein [Ignavibacteria bacterium]